MPNGGRWSYTSVRVTYPVGSRGLLFTVLLPHGISHHCSSKYRNNLYTKLHISFLSQKYLAQIRNSQRIFATAWHSAHCNLCCIFSTPHFFMRSAVRRLSSGDTCLTALRYLPNRAAKDGLSHFERCPFATRYMPNAHSPLAFSIFPLIETAFSVANLTVNPYNLLG